MTRKNRRDPEDHLARAVWEAPGAFNRESRRAAGFRHPVGLVPEGVEAPQALVFPRAVVRLATHLTGRKNRKRRAREARRLTQAVVAGGYLKGEENA